MKTYQLVFAIIFATTATLFFTGWGARKTPANPAQPCLRISAAVSLKAVLEDARPFLSHAAGMPVQYAFGGSGTLAAQIARGAPVDIFISADRTNVANLAAKGLVDQTSITVLASNTLVLVVPAGTHKVQTLSDLRLPQIQRIALGEPLTVPAGRYAQQTLEYHHLWKELHDGGKLVMGENVAQVLAYVARGEADAGFVYYSDALSASDKVTLISPLPPSSHEPIEYVLGVLADSPHKNTAHALLQTLHDPAFQKILTTHGFALAPAPTTSPAP